MKRFFPEGYAHIAHVLSRLSLAMGTAESVIEELKSEPFELRQDIEWLRQDCFEKGFSSAAAGAARLFQILKSQSQSRGQKLDRLPIIDATKYLQ